MVGLRLSPQEEEVAGYQVMLDRRWFSCGTVDGVVGSRMRLALLEFQRIHQIPKTGLLDEATKRAIGMPVQPLVRQELSVADFAKIAPTPTLWVQRAQAVALGYNTALEMAAEKFHTTPLFLRKLNPGLDWEGVKPGVWVLAPNIEESVAVSKAGRVEVKLSDKTVRVVDRLGRVVAFFPCSIAQKAEKRPVGELKVMVAVHNPNYTFNPEVLREVARAEGIRNKCILPPGPNNPVGMAWIGLDKLGYGLHGTPEPEMVSRTESHGCFRLANWNADRLRRMVSVGTPVVVRP